MDDTAIMGTFVGLGLHLGYKGYLTASMDRRRLYVPGSNVMFNHNSLQHRKGTQPDSNFRNMQDRQPSTIIASMTGHTLEEVEKDSEKGVFKPEIVINVETESTVEMY